MPGGDNVVYVLVYFHDGAEKKMKSYLNYRILNLLLCNDQAGMSLRTKTEKNQIDWLAPHAGPVYDRGANVTLLGEHSILLGILNEIDCPYTVKPVPNQKTRRSRRGTSKFKLNVFNSFPTISAYLKSMPKNDVLVKTIGLSHEKRPIYVVEMGNPIHPTIALDCGMHAREWASPSFCLYLINVIRTKHSSWLDEFHFVIYPMLNPDGYVYTWEYDRYWRKNRNPNVDKLNPFDCHGVDLNRNYDVDWGNRGSSSDPCSIQYGGTYAFSEPETRAHRDHMASLSNVAAVLSYHSYTEVIIYPYTSTPHRHVQNEWELTALSGQMAENMAVLYNHHYRHGRGSTIFNVASGGSDDYFLDTHRTSISFTIEMRDTGAYGFAMPMTEIVPNAEENIIGVQTVLDWIRAKQAYTEIVLASFE